VSASRCKTTTYREDSITLAENVVEYDLWKPLEACPLVRREVLGARSGPSIHEERHQFRNIMFETT
jgi:hypothetical protein